MAVNIKTMVNNLHKKYKKYVDINKNYCRYSRSTTIKIEYKIYIEEKIWVTCETFEELVSEYHKLMKGK